MTRGRFKRFGAAVAAVTALLVLVGAAIALADGIQGDVDELATSSPSANGLDATQDVGTSHNYDYSAYVKETGNEGDDVFGTVGDTVSATVTITQNDLSWPAAVSAQFTAANAFTTYDQNRAGLLSVTVPTGTADAVINHIKVEISGSASNGQGMSPSKVVLNYNITAHAAACTPAYTVDFQPPFDDSTPSQLITNTMKSGRTVPVKITVLDLCTGDYVTDGTVTIAVSKANDTDGSSYDSVENYADSGEANGGTNVFRWTADPAFAAKGGGFWIYNLDSRNALNGSPLAVNQTYRINAYVGAQLATGTDWALLKPVK